MKLPTLYAVPALTLAAALGLSACTTPGPAAVTAQAATASAEQTITRDQVLAAQRAWGEALVKISATYDAQGLEAARKTAESVIDTAYGYDWGPVLFKPTLAAPPATFRTTRDGALAYFVGGDRSYPGDAGFGLKGWRSYQIDNAAIFIDGDIALSMGNVRLTDKTGAVTVVDKTWGYKLDKNGQPRIVLHHSSLPYKAS